MTANMDGTAVIFSEGAFGRPEGKTANGLVRYGRRYDILGVIDSTHSGRDAGDVVTGVDRRIPMFSSLHQAVEALGHRPDFLVIGLNPDDGRLPPQHRKVVRDALRMGVSVDSALRPYLHDDAEFPGLAQQSSCRIRSVGYPKAPSDLRAYSGALERVTAAKVAVVGTHTVVGKRTTTVRLARALGERGIKTEMVGTGETSWLQGVRTCVLLDSVVSRYVAGELEGVIVEAWNELRPDVFVLEGQGSFLNPAHAAGIELLLTAKPDAVVMQHALTRGHSSESDRYGLDALERHVRAAELLSGAPVVAIALNPEGCTPDECSEAFSAVRSRFGLLATDVLSEGSDKLAAVVADALPVRA